MFNSHVVSLPVMRSATGSRRRSSKTLVLQENMSVLILQQNEDKDLRKARATEVGYVLLLVRQEEAVMAEVAQLEAPLRVHIHQLSRQSE